MPIFETHFLVVEENIWFAEVEPYQAIQRLENEFLKSELLIASDAEDAYLQATAMTDKFSEANYDGPGDITNYFCKGICQLRKIASEESTDVASDGPREIDIDDTPVDIGAIVVRAKEELDVFKANG